MKKIAKILLGLAVFSSALLASNADDKIVDFFKNHIASKNLKIKSVKLKSSKDLKQIPNWRVYFLDIEANLKNKDINITEVVFSNGEYFTRDLISLNDGEDLRNEVGMDAKNSLYDKSHLIAGNKNAKNKLIVFSDPNCPFCQIFMPFVINATKKYPNEFALYYYDFPLNIHISAKGYTKAMIVAQKQGVKDAILRTYKARFRNTSSDENKLVKLYNKALKTNITVKQMNEPWVLKKMQKDEEVAKNMMINGTPALFVNGKKDPKRLEFKAIYDKLENK